MFSILRKISIGLGFVLFVIGLGLSFEHRGYDKGMLVECGQIWKGQMDALGIVPFGPRTYELFAEDYLYISLFALLFLATGFAGSRFNSSRKFNLVFRIVSGVTLIAIFYQLSQIFALKQIRMSDGLLVESYDKLLLESIPLDWVCLIIAISLFLVQAVISLDRSPRETELDTDRGHSQ